MGSVQKYYVFVGADDTTIDFAHYQPSGRETTEDLPRFLFTYAPDRAPDDVGHPDGQALEWELYIGPTRPVVGTPERELEPEVSEPRELSQQRAIHNEQKAAPSS